MASSSSNVSPSTSPQHFGTTFLDYVCYPQVLRHNQAVIKTAPNAPFVIFVGSSSSAFPHFYAEGEVKSVLDVDKECLIVKIVVPEDYSLLKIMKSASRITGERQIKRLFISAGFREQSLMEDISHADLSAMAKIAQIKQVFLQTVFQLPNLEVLVAKLGPTVISACAVLKPSRCGCLVCIPKNPLRVCQDDLIPLYFDVQGNFTVCSVERNRERYIPSNFDALLLYASSKSPHARATLYFRISHRGGICLLELDMPEEQREVLFQYANMILKKNPDNWQIGVTVLCGAATRCHQESCNELFQYLCKNFINNRDILSYLYNLPGPEHGFLALVMNQLRSGPALLILAELHLFEILPNADEDVGVAFAEKAHAQGTIIAMYMLGIHYYRAQQMDKAQQYFRKGAAKSEVNCMLSLLKIEHKKEMQLSPEEKEQWMQKIETMLQMSKKDIFCLVERVPLVGAEGPLLELVQEEEKQSGEELPSSKRVKRTVPS